MENLQADSFARDYHIDAELAANEGRHDDGAAHQDARRPRLRRRRGQPVEVPGRPVLASAPAPTTFEHALRRGRRRLHQQAAGRHRLPLLVPRHRGGARDRAHGRRPGARARRWTRPSCASRTSSRRRSSPTSRPLGWEYDSGNYPARSKKAMDKIGYDDLRKEQAEKRARGELMGIGISHLHRDRRRRAVEALRHPRHQDVRLAPRSASTRPARRSPASAPSRRARGTRRPTPRSSPRSWAFPAANMQVEEGDTDTAPYGLGTYASRITPTAGAAARDGGAQDPRQGEEDRRPPARSRARTTSSGSRASSRSRARRRRRRRSRRSPSPPTPTTRRGWRPGSRRSTTTIRRT